MSEMKTVIRSVSIRQMTTQPGRLLATVLGLAGGVALLFATLVVNATLHASIEADARGIAGDAALEVSAAGPTGLGPDVRRRVASTAGIRDAVSVAQVFAQLGPRRQLVRARILGLSHDYDSLFRTGVGDIAAATSYTGQQSRVWLSEGLAAKLDLEEGEATSLQTPLGRRTIEVAGVISSSPLQAIENGNFAILPLRVQDRLFHFNGRVAVVYATLDAGASLSAVRRELVETVGDRANVGRPGAGIRSDLRTFDSIGQLSTLASTAALIVAVFVIVNASGIAIRERRRSIATMLAIGVRRRSLIGGVAVEGLAVGLLASSIGTSIGLVLAKLLLPVAVSGYTFLPLASAGTLAVSPALVCAVLISGTTLSVLGSIIPAWSLAGARPVDAMRPAPSTAMEPESQRRRRVATVGCVAAILAVGAWLITASSARATTGASAAAEAFSLIAVALLLPSAMRLALSAASRASTQVRRPSIRLAIRGLGQQAGRTTMTAAALGIAGALVLAVGTAVGSFGSHIDKLATHWLGSPLYVDAQSANLGGGQPLQRDFAAVLKSVPGVKAAYPWRYAPIRQGSDQLLVYGVPVSQAARDGVRTVIGLPGVEQAQLVRSLSRGEVFLSRYAAQRHAVTEGDEFVIRTPGGRRGFRVAGVFDDVASFDSVVMDENLYRKIWHDGNADRFAIIPRADLSIAALRHRLHTMLVGGAQLNVDVLTRDEAVAKFFGLVKGTLSIARLFELVALVIAGLVILNTMLVSIHERRWEFGLTRAIGTTPRGLEARVVVEAFAIGLLGSAVALLVGPLLGALMVTATNQKFAWAVAYDPAITSALVTLAAATAIAVVAALYPSRAASRTPIVRALRME